jgi:hypothetical protein
MPARDGLTVLVVVLPLVLTLRLLAPARILAQRVLAVPPPARRPSAQSEPRWRGSSARRG